MRWGFRLICVSAVVSSLLLGACGDRMEAHSFSNEGALCLHSETDGALHVGVQFPPCLSSTCDQVLGTSCTVAVSGNEISVTSNGTYESPVYGSCSSDCRALLAECKSEEPLAPGDYTLVHGDNRADLTLPVSATGRFTDMAPFFFCEQP